MASKKEYYNILGIPRTSSKEEIKRAFRKLARKYHPDVNPDDPGASEKFKDINEAYMVLEDDKKREMYDKFGVVEGDASTYPGAGAARGASSPGGGRVYRGPDGTTYVYTDGNGAGINFEDLFGGMGGRRGSGRPGGGTGGSDFFNDLGDIFDVLNRGGSTRARGPRTNVPREGEDLRYDMEIDFMDAFNGDQRKVSFKDPTSGEQRTITVKIPAGVRDEQKLRLTGLGMPGADGGPPGDLYIAVHVRGKHGFERKDNDDIVVTAEVPFTTAALGGKVPVQGIDRALTVTVPAGTKDGTTLRLKEQGFTRLQSGTRGNLLVEIKVKVPESITKQQRKILEELRESGL